MAGLYFASDFHLDHKNIGKYRLEVRDAQDNEERIEKVWKTTITKRDLVYCLGDMCFSEASLDRFKTWPGRKILICGNHDRDHLSMQQLVDSFDEVYSLLKYKEFWLSHPPIHSDELRGRYNLHGHLHYHTVKDWRYYNCCVEHGILHSLQEVRDVLEQRKKQREYEYGL